MARYESKSEFWEIEVRGKTVAERAGKLGEKGTDSTRTVEEAWQVTDAVRKGIEEKLAAGFHAIHAANEGLADSPKIRENAELEETIADDPSDEKRWLVWADWLQQEGDPRGEYIALRARALHTEAGKYAGAHASEMWGKAEYVTREPFKGSTWTGGWEGAVPEPIEASISWDPGRMGFVDRVTALGLDEEGLVATAIARLVASPMGRFTRALALEIGERYSGASGQPDYSAVVSLLARAKPRALRTLEMRAGGYQLSWSKSGNLGPLLAQTPRLEELYVNVGSVDLGDALDLPKLRTLMLETGGLDAKNLHAIANAKWPSLEKLIVFFGTPTYGGNAGTAEVEAILRGSYPKLETLALCNSEIQGEIARAVLGSPLLKQVKFLDLSKGTLTDEETEVLLDRAGDLAHVERINLEESYLSPEFEEKLRATFGARVRTGGQRYEEMIRDRAQHAPGGVFPEWAPNGFRYSSVGE